MRCPRNDISIYRLMNQLFMLFLITIKPLHLISCVPYGNRFATLQNATLCSRYLLTVSFKQ